MKNEESRKFCARTTPESVEKLCSKLKTNKSGLAIDLQTKLGGYSRNVSTIQKWLKGQQSVPLMASEIIVRFFRDHGIELTLATESLRDPSAAVFAGNTAFPALVSMTVETTPVDGRNRVAPDPSVSQKLELSAAIHRGIHDEEFLSADGELYYRGEIVLTTATLVLDVTEEVVISRQAHFPPSCFFMQRSIDRFAESNQYWTIRFGPIEQGTFFEIDTVCALEGKISESSALHLHVGHNGLKVRVVEDHNGPVSGRGLGNAIEKIREKLLSEALDSRGRIASAKFLEVEISDD